MVQAAIAVQLYTLRDFTRTRHDLVATIKRLKAIGYDAVQLSTAECVEPRTVRDLLQSAGMIACGSHTSYERLRDATERMMDDLHILGCTYVAPGSMPVGYRCPGHK